MYSGSKNCSRVGQIFTFLLLQYLTIQWSEILKIKGENAFMYLKFVIKILG